MLQHVDEPHDPRRTTVLRETPRPSPTAVIESLRNEAQPAVRARRERGPSASIGIELRTQGIVYWGPGEHYVNIDADQDIGALRSHDGGWTWQASGPFSLTFACSQAQAQTPDAAWTCGQSGLPPFRELPLDPRPPRPRACPLHPHDACVDRSISNEGSARTYDDHALPSWDARHVSKLSGALTNGDHSERTNGYRSARSYF